MPKVNNLRFESIVFFCFIKLTFIRFVKPIFFIKIFMYEKPIDNCFCSDDGIHY